jgi:hypothetical protein
MAGPKETDGLARLNQQLEPLQRAGQRFARDIEKISKALGTVRQAIEAARERSDLSRSREDFRLSLWVLQQFLAAKDNPRRPGSRAWLALGQLTPREIVELLNEKPDLREPKRRGRPRRSDASKLKLVAQLAERIKRTGERPTPAARKVLAGHSRRQVHKGEVDYLVRLWKNRAFKSR